MMKKNKSKTRVAATSITFFKTLFMFSFVIAVVYAGILLRQFDMPEILPLETIEVKGDFQFLDKNKIVSLLEQNIDGGYFTVDLTGLRELLMQQAWIKNVSLRRQWPAGINVYVEEKRPVAYWNQDAYLSESGDIFQPEKRINNLMLPVLSGPDGHHADVWKFMNVLYSEMALHDYQVIRLDLDERRAWQMVIATDVSALMNTSGEFEDKGIMVKLGRFETEKRLQRFIRVLPVLIANTQDMNDGIDLPAANKTSDKKIISVIDMRYPNGFAVQLSSRRMREA